MDLLLEIFTSFFLLIRCCRSKNKTGRERIIIEEWNQRQHNRKAGCTAKGRSMDAAAGVQ